MAKKPSLHDLLTELQSFVKVEAGVLAKAKKIKLSNAQYRSLNYFIESWKDGLYDEDPELLRDNLISLMEE
jgi:hypothetical protein